MAHEKDITEKLLEDFGDVFSDIVNVLLFNGKEIIAANELRQALPRSAYKAAGKVKTQERDVAKYWEAGGVTFALFGLENQSAEDEFMPARVISYDGAEYRSVISKRDSIRQLNKKKEQNGKTDLEVLPSLYPAITIVLYFSDKRWEKPKRLSECFNLKDNLKPYFNDYKINLFEIAYLTDEQVAMFKSDFKYVAELYTQLRKVREGIIKEPAFSNSDTLVHAKEVMELLHAVTGDNRFEEAYAEAMKGGNVNMFELFDIYEAKGEANKERQLIEDAIRRGDSPESIAHFMNVPLEKVKTIENELKVLA